MRRARLLLEYLHRRERTGESIAREQRQTVRKLRLWSRRCVVVNNLWILALSESTCDLCGISVGVD